MTALVLGFGVVIGVWIFAAAFAQAKYGDEQEERLLRRNSFSRRDW